MLMLHAEQAKKDVYIRDIFSKLPSDHLLSHLDLDVCLAIVHSKAQTDKVREDGCCAFRGADGRSVGWRGEGAWEREAVLGHRVSFLVSVWGSPIVRASMFEGRAGLVSIRRGLDVTYGTMSVSYTHLTLPTICSL